MENIGDRALDLHKKLQGKLEIKNKVSLKNRIDLSLVYTPGVARVSEEIYKNKSLAKIYTIKHNSVAVATDGSAVLGLGNLGPLPALPVMEGKCLLFKKFANIDAFPLCLASQDTASTIATLKNIAPSFGGINLEDIAAPRCFEIENRLVEELDIPVMHDDQHGTATVVLAAVINVLKLKKITKQDAKIVINGAGAAGTGIAKLLSAYGCKKVIVCDSKGAIYRNRNNLNEYKKRLAELTNPNGFAGNLAGALTGADIFIGVSVKDILTSEMIQTMNEKPAIFVLANPFPEINPALARDAGASIVATGRSDLPNQINNILAFPGIFRGALDNQVRKITPKMLILAAKNLASFVKKLSFEQILPNPLDPEVPRVVAAAIKEPG